MKRLRAEFVNGWLHFWTTFRHSLWFVLGFAVASVVSSLLYEAVKYAVRSAAQFL